MGTNRVHTFQLVRKTGEVVPCTLSIPSDIRESEAKRLAGWVSTLAFMSESEQEFQEEFREVLSVALDRIASSV